MCEQLLSDTLEEKIQVNVLLKWLISKNLKDECFKEIQSRDCLQGDFVLFFLNYIHEIQTSSDKKGEVSQKNTTPKQRKQDSCDNEGLETPTVKRRSALFPNSVINNHIEADFNQNLPKTNHSTPKLAQSSLNESYASPLSPLYNRQNFHTPKDRHSSPKVTPKLCLGDFITYDRRLSNKKVQQNLNENVFVNSEDYPAGSLKARRINPTNLNQRRSSSMNFRKCSNSFTFKNEADEVVSSSEDQRSFLVEERMKIVSRKNSSDNLPLLAVSKSVVTNRRKEVLPIFEFITFRQQLEIVVSIYSFLLDNSFVLNLTSELYFLVSLLLSREYEDIEDDGSPNNSLNLGVAPLMGDYCDINVIKYMNSCCIETSHKVLFRTIHNRIYFVSKTLENQINLLKALDRATLRLLIENRRLRQFSRHRFLTALAAIYEEKADKVIEIPEQVQANVCFISDTDNRDNFPNDPSFHAFRKQRDLFYEILRIWENNHLQNAWNFSVALAGKIKALLNMHVDPANLVHFARLFKAQLLMNTCGTYADDDAVSESQLSFLSSLPNVNAEKLSRLKSRIVSKQPCTGINSSPTFSGYQEFYRDFVVVAANHVFNRHLNDALVSEILDLNDTKFNCSDLDDHNALVDLATQKSYLLCVKTLRILAKFLGFLESLPYKSDCAQISQNVVACQIHIRNKIQPSLSLRHILANSVTNKTLILTVPWVTKYLAMLDYITLRLLHLEDVYRVLFEVYYLLTVHSEHGNKRTQLAMPVQNVLLVKLCLGWLFELPHFPEGLYYSWLSENLSKNHKCAFLVRQDSGGTAKEKNKSHKGMFLDEMPIVDQSALYVCCPYLQEIKNILSSDANTSNSTNVTVKHITPVTASLSSSDLSSKRLQHQLEEAFFSGQPVSIRKTVEFISERVASACVKEICNEIVPTYKKLAIAEFREILIPLITSTTVDSEHTKFTALMNFKAAEFAEKSLKDLQVQIDDRVKCMASARIHPAMESLLATDVLEQTKEVCISIAARTCMERVQQWINSHVNLGIFMKDFDAEVKRVLASGVSKSTKAKPVFMLPTFGKNVEHNHATRSGADTVESIRSCIWEVMEKPRSVTVSSVSDLLGCVYQSITQRCDVNEYILVLINKLLVDLALFLSSSIQRVLAVLCCKDVTFYLLLVTHRPEMILEQPVIAQVCLIWKKSNLICKESSSSSENVFKNLICPRNIALLNQSPCIEMSWESLHRFICILLREELLTSVAFKTQIAAVYKQLQNEETLRYLTNCLQGIVSDLKKTDGSESELTSLLCFLTDNYATRGVCF